jgi:hypothetical protein
VCCLQRGTPLGLGPRLEAEPYGAPGVLSPRDLREMIANHHPYEGGFGRAHGERYDVADGLVTQTSARVEKANGYLNDGR